MPTMYTGGRPPAKQAPAGGNKNTLIAVGAVLMVLLAAFLIWRTSAAPSVDNKENEAAINQAIKQGALQSGGVNYQPVQPTPATGVPLPPGKGRR